MKQNILSDQYCIQHFSQQRCLGTEQRKLRFMQEFSRKISRGARVQHPQREELMEKKTKNLRSKGKLLTPILQIGKNGLTQGSLDLIDRELEQKQLIKIKFLKGALPEGSTKSDRKELGLRIAKETESQVVEQVGNVLVLYRA